MKLITIGTIAQICHEANRRLCESQDDVSVLPWNRTETSQREGLLLAVRGLTTSPLRTAAQQHAVWMQARVMDGWRYGETLDREAKVHPNLVPYEKLDSLAKAKGELFMSIVRALAPLLTTNTTLPPPAGEQPKPS